MVNLRQKSGILMFLFTMIILLLPHVVSAAHEQKVIDEANLFSEEEKASLTTLAEKNGAKRGVSYYIITTEDTGSGDVEDYTDNFYHEEIKIDDEEVDAIVLTIDMLNREVDIAGFGTMADFLNDERVDMVQDNIAPHLTDSSYYHAMETFLTSSFKYSGFKPNANPQNPLYNIFVQLLLAVIVGAGIVWGMVHNAGGKVTTNRRTYENSDQSKILRHRDRYIRTSVTKRRKPKPKSSSGGGRSGRGGGRMTSGGSRRSGGKRSF